MFTGIIEATGRVENFIQEATNKRFRISSPISRELKVDQSVSHNGVCLTVVEANASYHDVVAVSETLVKTTLDAWQQGDVINLERCMQANGRFDGHIVQGHVDQVGICLSVKDEAGSWLYDFQYDDTKGNVTVEKGSISVNGVSLTCFNSENGRFRVAIIPYTHSHTQFHQLKAGDSVNLEFDIIGKYVQRLLKKE